MTNYLEHNLDWIYPNRDLEEDEEPKEVDMSKEKPDFYTDEQLK